MSNWVALIFIADFELFAAFVVDKCDCLLKNTSCYSGSNICNKNFQKNSKKNSQK